MSSIYALEPATSGKVVLHTTVGDIEIELWAKETPLACKNFVQHCLDGYYSGCIFHRVVKDFIIQTGDPTGTGDGGEAAYGEAFPLEVHSRLRFNHRGIVAMASADEGNASQFFFLMAQQAEQLNRKHTIFGKVTGDTIYNLVKINEADLGPNDRPLFPAKITGAEIQWDPFDGSLTARKTRAQEEREEEERKKKAKRKPKATKNSALLSFAGDDDDEDNDEGNDEAIKGRMKARQHFSKSADVRESIARQEEEEKERKRKRREERARESEREERDREAKELERKQASSRSFDEQMRHKVLQKMPSSSSSAQEGSKVDAVEVDKLTAEAEERKAGEKRKKRAGLHILEEQRSKYRKRSKAERQAKTMERLKAFQNSLRSVEAEVRQPAEDKEESEEQDEQNAEKYSAKLMYGKIMDEDDEDDANDQSWKAHKLKFARTVATANEDDYVVLDPSAPGGEGLAERWGRGDTFNKERNGGREGRGRGDRREREQGERRDRRDYGRDTGREWSGGRRDDRDRDRRRDGGNGQRREQRREKDYDSRSYGRR